MTQTTTGMIKNTHDMSSKLRHCHADTCMRACAKRDQLTECERERKRERPRERERERERPRERERERDRERDRGRRTQIKRARERERESDIQKKNDVQK